MFRREFLLGLAGAAFFSDVASAHDHAHHSGEMEGGAPLSGRSLYNLESHWTTAGGETVALSALRGEPVVVAMAYTSCKDICPAIVADMQWLEKHLAPASAVRVRFAFFSFDSKVDTPQRLAAYADAHGLGDRWTLLNGDEDAVREFAAALGVRYRPDGQGGFDHSAILTLLDAGGEIAAQQVGTRADSHELLAKTEALLAAAH